MGIFGATRCGAREVQSDKVPPEWESIVESRGGIVDALHGFEITDRRAVYRPTGTVSLEEAVDMISAALVLAGSQGAREILIDITHLEGFASPDTVERYYMVERWAAEVGGRVRVAMVLRAEFIDPHEFGETVASNRGMTAATFTTEAAALDWLDGKEAPDP